MADTSISLNFSGVPSTVQQLHIHVEYAAEVATAITRMEAKVTALSDAVAKMQTDVSGLLASTTSLVEDVQRLLADNNTAEAVDALNTVATNLEQAKASIDALDTSVEAVDPQPVTPATPADELLG